MSRYSRWTRGRALALAVAAGYAVAACGGAADSTGPGAGNGDKPAANDLFVSATTGDAAGAGTQQQPFQTIAAALAASDSGQTIRVAGGMYAERVVLKSHVRIVGGYDPASWQRDTVHDSTTIGDSVMTVVGLHVSDVVLDGLHLRNLAGSVYGVVTFDSSAGIEIVGSTISAPRGFAGSGTLGWGTTRPDRAAAGSPGAKGGGCLGTKAGGAGGNVTWGGLIGGDGGAGQLGSGADGLSGEGSGGNGGTGGGEFGAGKPGASASAVSNTGRAGRGGTSEFGYSVTDGYSTALGNGLYGQSGGDGAGGGGGGGGGGNLAFGQCGGGGGGGGQGGVGGNLGDPGSGGGPAIGLVVGRASDVRLVNSMVIAGGGGNGGAGTLGELGGLPGGGGTGGAGVGGGGAGGYGGGGIEGGRGGAGGGGAGGPSVGVLVFPSGVYTPTAVVYEVGPGGAGGGSPVVTSVGAPGDSASVKNLPG